MNQQLTNTIENNFVGLQNYFSNKGMFNVSNFLGYSFGNDEITELEFCELHLRVIINGTPEKLFVNKIYFLESNDESVNDKNISLFEYFFKNFQKDIEANFEILFSQVIDKLIKDGIITIVIND